ASGRGRNCRDAVDRVRRGARTRRGVGQAGRTGTPSVAEGRAGQDRGKIRRSSDVRGKNQRGPICQVQHEGRGRGPVSRIRRQGRGNGRGGSPEPGGSRRDRRTAGGVAGGRSALAGCRGERGRTWLYA